MASRTEGIALLSMYNDEEEEEEEEEEEPQPEHHAPDAMDVDDDLENPPEDTPQARSVPTPPFHDEDLNGRTLASPSVATRSTPTPPRLERGGAATPHGVSPENLGSRKSRLGVLSIVDYEHDETAMSPEDGEIRGAGRVVLSMETRSREGTVEEKITQHSVLTSTSSSQPSLSQPSEQPDVSKTDTNRVMDDAGGEAEVSPFGVDAEVSPVKEEGVDPLKEFLSPPPNTQCPQELQDKINKFLSLKRSGKSFNSELRKMKAYRNPDFLQHAVRYQEINQTGTCFSKDVFNPEGYDPRDFYDEIEADMRREVEKREIERKRSPKVEFVSGGTQANVLAQQLKVNCVPGVSIPPASGQPLVSAGVAARDGRPNKKSKWDKVDTDPKNPLVSGEHDTVSNSGAHAALLSSSNAGAGYTAFAQQRRKEAEEKRSSERKFERRS